jgi:hypothetical protein
MYPSSNYYKQAVDEFGNHDKCPAGFVVDHGVEPHFIQEFKRKNEKGEFIRKYSSAYNG